MKKFAFYLLSNLFLIQLLAQTDAGLYRYPDVSKTQIVFTYANDLWVMPKEGGEAIKLSSPLGVESFPRFSPDGRSIAFTGNYDGNKDVYVIPVSGGIPTRLTSHGFTDRVVGWQPDGKRVLFASARESGRNRFNQMYTVAPTGGPSLKLPLAYAEFASYSPDGKKWLLHSVPRLFAIGKDTVEAGKLISIFSTWQTILQKISPISTPKRVMNFLCGTMTRFISFLIVALR